LDNLDPRVHGDDIEQFSETVDFVRGDILSPSSLAGALREEVDVVFHEDN
jgi:nucleoside-diphosphate-sugar epimerase